MILLYSTCKGKSSSAIRHTVAVSLPPSTYGHIAPWSRLAAKNMINIGAGVVDRDYCGNVSVLLFNHINTDFVISHHDHIVQFILENIVNPPVEEVDDLDNTTHRTDGFGSTGV
jgi:dUTP pyrophosphatase